MGNRINPNFMDARAHLRVDEDKSLLWYGEDVSEKRRARVRNISISGMLLEGDLGDIVNEGRELFFESPEPDFVVPKKGVVVWRKRLGASGNRWRCGIKFTDCSDEILLRLGERIQKKIIKLIKRRQITGILSIFFIVMAVVLVGYIVLLSYTVYKNMDKANREMAAVMTRQSGIIRRYASLYKLSQQKLADSISELSSIKLELAKAKHSYEEERNLLFNMAKELETTKSILKETEQMLAKVKEEKKILAANTTSSSGSIDKKQKLLQNTITELKSKNEALGKELSELKKKLDYYEGKINNISEAKTLVAFYRDKIRQVKIKIKQFTKDTLAVKIAAAKERDRIRMMLGNNGYFFKDGKLVVVDEKRYMSASLPKREHVKRRDVAVDVMFVE